MMPMCWFLFIPPCVFHWIIIDVTTKNDIMAIMMVYGTKWRVEFDNILHIKQVWVIVACGGVGGVLPCSSDS